MNKLQMWEFKGVTEFGYEFQDDRCSEMLASIVAPVGSYFINTRHKGQVSNLRLAKVVDEGGDGKRFARVKVSFDEHGVGRLEIPIEVIE